MQLYTLQQATADLDRVIARAVGDHEEAAIVSDSGTVFLVPQQEFESMRETLRLLSDQRSLNALLAGHSLHDAGQVLDSLSIEQIFNDLQDSHS
jgi:PHD/YefM family antitoxin component YafN of YafNO toxin-antitoxin module